MVRRLKTDYYNCYKEQDVLKAMQFAVHDITGRTLRPTVLETILEDFNNEE